MRHSNKIRIKDIASMAGVSEGTVDRVLHNRGEVSEKSRIAVEKVLHEIDYSPNILARSLASKKQYRFVCVIPSFKEGDYWQQVDKGFDMAASEFAHFNILVDKKYFDQYDPQSFIDITISVLSEDFDAVFIAPIFRNEAIDFTTSLDDLNIPFSFIDSVVEETNFVTYYGQNSSQSGYVGAKLLLDTLKPYSKILVVRTQRKSEGVSNQTINRYKGFSDYLNENNSFCEPIEVMLSDDNEDANKSILQNIFDNHPDIKAAITFNSKVYRIAKFINSTNRKDIVLLGYDTLQENIIYLKQGIISYLIAQRPDKQAFSTFQDMCNKLIFNRDIKRINYMPIDILIKENIDYYVGSKD